MIANAPDEQALTGTAEPQILQDNEGHWQIHDWGRGIRYEHLTQNENKEKLTHRAKVVGKFGVGLKDALATFDHHRVTVVIRSRYGDITTGKQAKHGFDDIKTLPASAWLIQAATSTSMRSSASMSSSAIRSDSYSRAGQVLLHHDGCSRWAQAGIVYDRTMAGAGGVPGA